MPYARFYFCTLCLIWLCAIGIVSSQNSSAPVRDTKKRIQKKIVGGEEAPVGRFPYMCSLRVRGDRKHKCGGMVIDPEWVLTAAHCVDPDSDGSVGLQPVIYCGIHDINDHNPELTFTTIDAVLHHRWNGKVKRGFDIAMLKLNRTAESSIPDILAKENPLSSGSRLTALGWGRSESSRFSEKLRMADDLVFVPPDICRNNGYDVDAERVVCAGLSEENTCEGDSGGPLLQPDAPEGDLEAGHPELDLLVGITSYGLGACTDPSSNLGIYTYVGHYSKWIRNVINAAVNEENGTEITTSDDEMTLAVVPADEVSVPPNVSSAVAPEDQDSALPSVLEIDFDYDFDPPFDSSSNPTAMDSPEGRSPLPARSAQPPQPDPCTTSPKVEDVVAAIEDDDSTAVQTALDCGLDPESRYTASFGTANNTLLQLAARRDSSDSAKALIQAGADVEATAPSGNKALHHCGIHGSVSVAKVLLDSGANVNAKGAGGRRALHSAAGNGHVDVEKLLLDSGANVDAKDTFGQTPLHWAARGYRANTPTKILVDAGADIDAADDDGETPLHIAAERGNLDVVKVLVEAGASKKIRDENGDRPQDIVCDAAYPDCTRATRLAIEDLLEP